MNRLRTNQPSGWRCARALSRCNALRWRHIDFERREVRIETRVDPYGNEEVPKTVAGIRAIPLGEGVVSALRWWRGETKFALKDAILDHALSDGDSSQLCERMRERNIPFITYSGYDHPRGPRRGGVHIRKPASMSLLVTTVQSVLALQSSN